MLVDSTQTCLLSIGVVNGSHRRTVGLSGRAPGGAGCLCGLQSQATAVLRAAFSGRFRITFKWIDFQQTRAALQAVHAKAAALVLARCAQT